MEHKINIVSSPKEFYVQELNRFEEGRGRETQELDRIIFIISTGLVALSISYITQSDEKIFYYPYSLLLAWIFLVLTIGVHAFTYKLSVGYHEKAEEELEEWAGSKFSSPFSYSAKIRKTSRRIKSLNKVSFWLLIIGVIFLTFFVAYNFNIKNIKNQNKLPNGVLIKKVGDFRIYIVENGKARWINLTEFNKNGFKLGDVYELVSEEFDYYR